MSYAGYYNSWIVQVFWRKSSAVQCFRYIGSRAYYRTDGSFGSGKTTLLRILMGLERADSGRIDGLNGLCISAVFQEDRLCNQLDGVSNLRLVTPALGRAEAANAMKAVGLSDCIGQPIRELSGGQRRRVAILRGLLADYDFLILDEPFRGLDRETKRLVMEDTRRRCMERTVLLVTHDAAELEVLGVTELLTGLK